MWPVWHSKLRNAPVTAILHASTRQQIATANQPKADPEPTTHQPKKYMCAPLNCTSHCSTHHLNIAALTSLQYRLLRDSHNSNTEQCAHHLPFSTKQTTNNSQIRVQIQPNKTAWHIYMAISGTFDSGKKMKKVEWYARLWETRATVDANNIVYVGK